MRVSKKNCPLVNIYFSIIYYIIIIIIIVLAVYVHLNIYYYVFNSRVFSQSKSVKFDIYQYWLTVAC